MFLFKSLNHFDNKIDVDYVFFNEKYVYSTSTLTINNGEEIQIDSSFKKWYKREHHNKIILPDGEQFVPMTALFTAPKSVNNKLPFFVMPLPSFLEKDGLKSKHTSVENLVTAIFLHEFSHSQQLETLGKKVNEFEKQKTFETEISDNLIQDLYEKDKEYKELFEQEIFYLYGSLDKASNTEFQNNIKLGKEIFKKRQDLLAEKKLKEIDAVFLTMEGLGQYLMYLWLIDTKGAGLENTKAIEEVRRSKTKWSQEEGFVFFLINQRLHNNKEWLKSLNTIFE